MGHTRAIIYCQEATVRHNPDIPGWGFVFQQDGELAHRARDAVVFLERKVLDFISPKLWPPNSPDLNPVDHGIWNVLHEKVYQSTIASVSELHMRLINERDALSSQSWMLLSSSGAVVSALGVRGSGHTLITKHKVSAILSCIYQKLLNI